MGESAGHRMGKEKQNIRKLYIVEGLPGSGKTTFARKLSEALREELGAHQVHLCVEGDLHPVDMAWCALLTQTEAEGLYQKYPDLSAEIRQNMLIWEDRCILAYTKIDGMPDELYRFLESKEVYDHRVPTADFCSIHFSRWRLFGSQAQGTHVFECSLLQNAVNELLLFHNASEDMICDYIHSLLKAVSSLTPEIIYLDLDTMDSINRAASERVDDHGNRVWEERVMEYICDSPYGKAHGLHGKEGMMRYFTDRKRIEKSILDALYAEKHMLSLQAHAQDEQVNLWIRNFIADKYK